MPHADEVIAQLKRANQELMGENKKLREQNGRFRTEHNNMVAECNQMQQSAEQLNHLVIAMLHTFGPTVTIKIDQFFDQFSEAVFAGNMGLDDDGTYTANLTIKLS